MQGQVEKSMMTFVTMNTKKARLAAFSGSKEKDLNICTFMGFPARAEITMQKKQTINRAIAPNATVREMKETKVSVDPLSGWPCCEKKSPKNIMLSAMMNEKKQKSISRILSFRVVSPKVKSAHKEHDDSRDDEYQESENRHQRGEYGKIFELHRHIRVSEEKHGKRHEDEAKDEQSGCHEGDSQSDGRNGSQHYRPSFMLC